MKKFFIYAFTTLTLLMAPAAQAFDLTEALEQRYDGKADAPVVFYDFSSLSCPHCATFHDELYPRIKADFLDTGKAKMIFGPMPLNASALDGEKIARCVPKDQYIDALKLLYSNQQKWAFTRPHRDNLIEQAKLLGLSKEEAEQCLNNEELTQGILQMVKDGAYSFNVSSTPTFIFEEGERELKGVGSYDKYERLLNYLYDQSQIGAKKTIDDIPEENRLTIDKIEEADKEATAKLKRLAPPKIEDSE